MDLKTLLWLSQSSVTFGIMPFAQNEDLFSFLTQMFQGDSSGEMKRQSKITLGYSKQQYTSFAEQT